MTSPTERIDWSQLWYPGPRRTFTAAELARAGGDRPSRTFLMILAVNAIAPATLVLQLAPASVVWALAARATLPLFKRERLTLGEELDAAARYLEVMQERLGERLRFSIAADAEARAQAVPPGLLLTLVENAVEHGVGPSLSGADVQVAARREGERLLVEVADSGAGLPARLDEGVGLSNSRMRLAQAFGADAQLQLLPRREGGAIARLELPLTSHVIDPCS